MRARPEQETVGPQRQWRTPLSQVRTVVNIIISIKLWICEQVRRTRRGGAVRQNRRDKKGETSNLKLV